MKREKQATNPREVKDREEPTWIKIQRMRPRIII